METALKETEAKLVNLPDKKFDSAEFLKNLPHLPGVYRYFDKDGNLLYVGKARDLKRRVLQLHSKKLCAAHQIDGRPDCERTNQVVNK